MPKDHQLGLAALQPLQLEQAPRASLRTPAAPRRPTFQQYKDKLRDGYVIDDVTSSDPKFVRDTGEQHDPRRIIGVPVRDTRPVEIRTAEWARLGLAREVPINWIVPAGSDDAYAQVAEHYKHLIDDAVGLKREYLQGNFGVGYGATHKEVQAQANAAMLDLARRMASPSQVIGVDEGKPGGDHTVVHVMYKHPDGTVTARCENKPVAWRHCSGKVVREAAGGGRHEWSKDGRVWNLCPPSVSEKLVESFTDPKKYTPMYEGEMLTFEPMLPTWTSKSNADHRYRYDIRRHQVELQTRGGIWRPSRYVTLTDLQSNRFTRVA